MSITNEYYYYQCGACEDGEIKLTHKIKGEMNSIRIEKCTRCKHEYGLKAVQQLERKPDILIDICKRFVREVSEKE